MTLDEAIKHCEEVAEEARNTPCIKGGLVQKCGEEHAQLATWLKELKRYREAEVRKAEQEAYDEARREAMRLDDNEDTYKWRGHA